MGLSSYLVFFGIYSSAISVSQDSKLRASIRKSVEAEVNFIGNIASAEMTHTVTERVIRKVEAVSELIPRDTGIATSLTFLSRNEFHGEPDVTLIFLLELPAKISRQLLNSNPLLGLAMHFVSMETYT